MWVDIIFVVFVIYVISLQFHAYYKMRKLEKRSKRIDGDINSLHNNQDVIVSSLNEAVREMRKNEKNTKILKRHISSRPVSRPVFDEEGAEKADD